MLHTMHSFWFKKYVLLRVPISSLDPSGDIHTHKYTYAITNKDYGIAGVMGVSQAAKNSSCLARPRGSQVILNDFTGVAI